MNIEHQFQLGKSTCGQTCVAMVLGKPVKDIVKLFGHAHTTKTWELRLALAKHGYKTPQRLVTYRGELPALAIVKVPHRKPDGRPRRGWHWVLYANGKFYDPLTDVFIEYRISSFLPIVREERIPE